MLRGFYTAASGMIAQQRKTEVLTSNLSNVNTPGFKADQTGIRSFPEMLLSRLQHPNLKTGTGNVYSGGTVGTVGTGVYMQETLPNFIQGQLLETELPTDLAITDGQLPEGSAVFFRLQEEDGGEAYTRNGNFTLDAEGFLVNPQGLYVLSDEGARIQLENDGFTVAPDGIIRTAEGDEAARIGVSFAAEPMTMLKEGTGLFRTEDGAALPSAYAGEASFALQQGFLEQSNVDASRTMTDLMAAYRTFEANQKVLQAYDKSMEKAVNEIGRVN